MRQPVKRFALSIVLISVSGGAHFAIASESGVSLDSMVNLQNKLAMAIACEDARKQVFDLYFESIHKQEVLQENLFISRGDERLTLHTLHGNLQSIHHLLHNELENFARMTSEENERDPALHMVRLEMRSHIEPEYEEINRQLDGFLAEARRSAEENQLACMRSVSADGERSFEAHAGEISYAARRTMATAYQSCRVLELPPVTNQVGDVEGVNRSVAVDSVGWGRSYKNLRLLKQTHYYHRETTFSGRCMDQNKKPLVYDYGGAPGFDAGNGLLDLFVNVGGGPALGIDCSAFVSTAAVSAGVLFKKGTPNRAIYTRFVSRDFIDATKSGWSCFENVRVDQNSTLQSGDIAAYRGHVVIVESVGSDPFGLRAVYDRSQCVSLAVRNFDFVFIQSSPSQEHLGINRYLAKEYLEKAGLMTDLFMHYAKQACLSKFDGVERTPSTEKYGVVRHRKNSQCLAARINLRHEDCVASCAALQDVL
jgi:hypothetical protein